MEWLDQDKDTLDFLVRQRRNLMIASIMLFLVKGHGLHPIASGDPEMTILGYKFSFATSIDVPNILTLAVLYFIIRFAQYFQTLKGGYIKKTLREQSADYVKNLAKKSFVSSKIQKGALKVEVRDSEITRVDPYEIKISSWIEKKPNQHHGEERVVTLNKWERFRVSFYAWRQVINYTPIFTEFILPVFFGLGASGYYFSKMTIIF